MAVKRMDSSRSLLYQAPYEGRKAVLVMNMPAEARRKAGASNATLGPYSRRTAGREKKMFSLYLYGPGHFRMDMGSQMTLQMTSGLWRVLAGARLD